MWLSSAFIPILTLHMLGSVPLRAADAPSHGARLRNPFCSIPTYVSRSIGSQGLALIGADGAGVIYIGSDEATGGRAYRDFLMAHECCHHTRGHLRRLNALRRENALLAVPFVNRSTELDADCCAAVTLARAGRRDAVQEAADRMRSYGAQPTGAQSHPSGNARARLIEGCAASVTAASPTDAAGRPAQ